MVGEKWEVKIPNLLKNSVVQFLATPSQTEKSDLLGNQKRRFDVAVSSSRTPPSLTKSEQR
jgi:hypothetical protein